MKLILMKTRFPEDIRECTPFLIGGRGDTIGILCDADIDGYEPISRKEAEEVVQDFTGLDIKTFAEVAKWRDIIVRV